jgi:hypothetical protein
MIEQRAAEPGPDMPRLDEELVEVERARLFARRERDDAGKAAVGRRRNPDIARGDLLAADLQNAAGQRHERLVIAPDCF